MAGAFVVLEHRERRPAQRFGFFLLESLAVVLLGEVGGDHLEDPTAQDAQRLGVMVLGHGHEVDLGLLALLRVDRELTGGGELVEAGHDRPCLRGVDLALAHGRREHVVPIQRLSEAEVGAGFAADLPGLDRDPVGSCPRAGVGRGAGALCFGEHPQLQCVELRLGLGEGGQGFALLIWSHRPQRRPRNRAEPLAQPVGEVDHRVEAVDRLAAHDSIQAPTTDRKEPLTCGFAQPVRRCCEDFRAGPGAVTNAPAVDSLEAGARFSEVE